MEPRVAFRHFSASPAILLQWSSLSSKTFSWQEQSSIGTKSCRMCVSSRKRPKIRSIDRCWPGKSQFLASAPSLFDGPVMPIKADGISPLTSATYFVQISEVQTEKQKQFEYCCSQQKPRWKSQYNKVEAITCPISIFTSSTTCVQKNMPVVIVRFVQKHLIM